MNMAIVTLKARKVGVKSRGVKKADLIRAIQKQEGNYPCFATAQGYCDRTECCWRRDCVGDDR